MPTPPDAAGLPLLQHMTLPYVILLVALAGAVGGGIRLLYLVDLETPAPFTKRRLGRFCLRSIQETSLGMGGAFAVLLIMLWMPSYNERADWSVKEVLSLICISLIAGFIARRLLPAAGRLVERQAAEAMKVSEEAERRSEEAVKRAEISMAITGGMASLTRVDSSATDREYSTMELERATKRDPTNRLATIVLGRLYKRENRLDDAIAALARFVETKRGIGQGSDKDVADALYNRACYYTLKWKARSDDSVSKAKAYEDLRESIRLSPENKEDARADPDLEALRSEDTFKQLVGGTA